jgi:phosphatidylglycerophosphate synthase
MLKRMRVETLIWSGAFGPRNSADWEILSARLEGQFVWLPWNWVTGKRTLEGLSPLATLPTSWRYPMVLERNVLFTAPDTRLRAGAAGVAVTSHVTTRMAERFLVASSGKPLDGIYSSFNRRVCRPFVRLLTHTPVTPNQLTLAGLLAAVVAAFLFARGTYAACVAGALMFFVSGLFDEMDGMVARIKFRESAFGTWFEGFVDNVTYVAIFAGITVGLHRQYGSWVLKYGVALMAGCVLSVIVIALQRKVATAPGRPHEYAGKMNRLLEAEPSNYLSKAVRQIHIFIKKGVLVHYVLLFSVLNALPIFLWLGAVGSNLTWIVALYFTYKFFLHRTVEPVAEDIRAAA